MTHVIPKTLGSNSEMKTLPWITGHTITETTHVACMSLVSRHKKKIRTGSRGEFNNVILVSLSVKKYNNFTNYKELDTVHAYMYMLPILESKSCVNDMRGKNTPSTSSKRTEADNKITAHIFRVLFPRDFMITSRLIDSWSRFSLYYDGVNNIFTCLNSVTSQINSFHTPAFLLQKHILEKR